MPRKTFHIESVPSTPQAIEVHDNSMVGDQAFPNISPEVRKRMRDERLKRQNLIDKVKNRLAEVSTKDIAA